MNTKLHAVTDANGRPLSFFMTAGQVSDYTGAAASLDDLSKPQWLLDDRGYDAEWFRDALQAKAWSCVTPLYRECVGIQTAPRRRRQDALNRTLFSFATRMLTASSGNPLTTRHAKSCQEHRRPPRA